MSYSLKTRSLTVVVVRLLYVLPSHSNSQTNSWTFHWIVPMWDTLRQRIKVRLYKRKIQKFWKVILTLNRIPGIHILFKTRLCKIHAFSVSGRASRGKNRFISRHNLKYFILFPLFSISIEGILEIYYTIRISEVGLALLYSQILR